MMEEGPGGGGRLRDWRKGNEGGGLSWREGRRG